MRKYISIIFGVFLLSLAACTEEIVDPNDNMGDGNKIILSVKSSGAVMTRSADTDSESALALIDVYIMDENYNMFYKERLDNTASPVIGEGQFTLEKGRDEFEAGKKYFVYIVANSTLDMADDWTELKSLTQRNSNVHLSGMNIVEVASGDMPPKYFLMDGFAYVGDDEPEDMAAYVINDTRTDDTVLNATLYRAAAKIIVNITQGESVEFHKVLEDAGPLYSFYQLPISTLVVNPSVSGARHTSDKQTTIEWGLSPNNFHWTTDDNDEPVITYIGYAYANDWSNNNAVNETSLLFSIPMMWDADDNGSKEKSSPVNWYKVPVSKTNKFERNKCYVLNVNINAVGAEEKNVPVELRDIEYVTLDWQDVEVEIGENIAKYLTLNTDLVKIYDSNFDLDQLTFTSSSPIKSIKLKDVFSHNEKLEGRSAFSALEVTRESDGTTEAEYEDGDGVYAYYIDKFGQKVQLGTDPGFALKLTELPELTKDEILQLEKNLFDNIDSEEQHIRAVVPDEYKRALNGDIHIYSPIYPIEGDEELNWNSHFNTVRYLEFEVMNEQGLTATFRVEQTPLTVIRNTEGFFSYRSDFCINNARQHYNYNAFSQNFPILPMGETMPVDKYGPHHFLNPREPFWAVAVFIPYHVHECNENGDILSATCGYIDKNNAVNGELVYGLVHSSRDYYRSHGPDDAVFHRDHYVDINGNPVPNESTIKNGANKYYQAIGMPYKDLVSGKYYRRHYVGQAQATFWSKYVMKVHDKDVTDGNGNVTKHRGLADIALQVPDEKAPREYYWVANGGANKTLINHRMYNVRVTATSTEYTVALPRMMDEDGNPTDDRSQGYTMEGEVNSHLVSPSFTVASQLGSTSLPVNEGGYSRPGVAGFYEYAKHQCREYVETRYVDDDNSGNYTPGDRVYHYDDWRLPTKAEIDYIIQHQETSRTMDKVMNAQYYFIASLSPDTYTEQTVYSTQIPNYAAGYAGHFMRCVRDAYKEPVPVIYDQNYNIVSGNPVKSN